MSKTTLLFETRKDEQGRYECHQYKEVYQEEKHTNYHIDTQPSVFEPPSWVVAANELFQQGLTSNAQGGYSEYLTMMQDQFEQMRKMLHKQMNQFHQ